jgi:hypothetical protein
LSTLSLLVAVVVVLTVLVEPVVFAPELRFQ